METRIWSKSSEKWAYILMLRGQEVQHLKVTGSMLTLKRNVQKAIEGLGQGQDATAVGAKLVDTLDIRTIGKAEVSEGNTTLTLHAADGSKTLSFVTADNDANEIFQEIQARSGATFQQTKEDIGAVNAVMPPVVVGVLGGIGVAAVYYFAAQLAAGDEVQIKGFRRRAIQRMLLMTAEVLGTTGTIAVGVVLLILMVAWAAKRVVHRPQRTVWLPVTA